MPDRYTPDRSLTLTDGVVAIALTLLALDLKPDLDGDATSRQLLHYLGDHSGQYIAFVIAFYVISQYWLVHHRILRTATDMDEATVRVNLLFLFSVTLVPLTTYVNGAFSNALSVTLFAANLLLVGVAMTWFAELMHRHGLIEEPEDGPGRDRRQWAQVMAIAVPVVVAAMAWVIGGYANLFYLLFALGDAPGRFVMRRVRG